MNSPFLTGLDWRPIARKGAKPARMPIGIPIALRDGRSLGGYAGLQGPCRSDPPSDLVWAARGRLEAALATDKTDIVPVAAREWLNSTLHSEAGFRGGY